MGFLDKAIPVVILIVFIFILGSAINRRGALTRLWHWIKGLGADAKEAAAERREKMGNIGGSMRREIVYE